MKLLNLIESVELSPKEAGKLYSKHLNGGLYKIYKLLGFANMDIISAVDSEITVRNGDKFIDFSSAIGILALGHNHPKIINAEKLCHEKKLIDAIKVAPLKLQAALAYNLSQLLPDPLSISFFCVSGAEAVEGAMKLCKKAQGPGKTKFITAYGSYHGKTHGAMAVTKSGGFGNGFLMGIPDKNVETIPYGNINALKKVVNENKTSDTSNLIIAFILEPIQGQGVNVPPYGYLTEVVNICHENNILVIFDEVKAGMGRTGKFCSFQHEDAVPDVVTLSKALGGGKRAISAFVTSKFLFQKAYGKRSDAGLHSTTFGGLGASCAVAIETLNVLIDDNLISDSRLKGQYLHDKFEKLKIEYPDKIKSIKGRGLFMGIEFDYDAQRIRSLLSKYDSPLIEIVDSILIASIVSELNRKYKIITHFSASDLDVLHVMPPLIISYSQLDKFVDSINQILKTGFTKLITNFILQNLKILNRQ